MATFKSSIKMGVNWIRESVALFKTAPSKLMLLALTYIALFMMVPSIPGLQWFAFMTILIWPIFMAIAIAIFRNADQQKVQGISEIIQGLRPKVSLLMALGGASLIYGVLTSFVLNSDIQGLLSLPHSNNAMTESQAMAIIEKMMPLLLKFTLLLIPLIMATWFSPMLIAFNNYPVVKAIKSSIAGSLQYMVALGAAWLLLTSGMIVLMMVVGMIVGIISSFVPAFGQLLVPLVVFGCLLLATALMLAFQYVSYRDIFRAA
ncbi:hypothetical protein GALL_261310 [mine drainage metagenome]|uniref:Uncharacterized protein n=1 Tax=mine drainage metagenome TaxID=410659 RepID=A0A1J5RIW0_9ZZZZ